MFIHLTKLCFTLKSAIYLFDFPEYNFLFSLILSNITMVSLIEYPTIVNIDAINGEFIGTINIEYALNVIKTSCINATTAKYTKINFKPNNYVYKHPYSCY